MSFPLCCLHSHHLASFRILISNDHSTHVWRVQQLQILFRVSGMINGHPVIALSELGSRVGTSASSPNQQLTSRLGSADPSLAQAKYLTASTNDLRVVVLNTASSHWLSIFGSSAGYASFSRADSIWASCLVEFYPVLGRFLDPLMSIQLSRSPRRLSLALHCICRYKAEACVHTSTVAETIFEHNNNRSLPGKGLPNFVLIWH